MKRTVNHKEQAYKLALQCEELQAKMDAKWIEAKKQGDSQKAYDNDYWSMKKEMEAKFEEAKFHTIMAQDKKYASEHLWSDVHAYEILEEKTEKMLLVRRLKATRTEESAAKMQESFIPGGFIGHFDNSLQEWTFESDDKNPVIAIRKHKNGLWYAKGSSCCFTIEAEPREFYDYNF